MDLIIILLKKSYDFFEQALSTLQGWRVFYDLVAIAVAWPFIIDNEIHYHDSKIKFLGSSVFIIFIALFISKVMSILIEIYIKWNP